MKAFHLSDLHLGKRVNEFSMIEDQKDILLKIIKTIDEEKPDIIMIAGDVYDKSVPSAEAVEMFDDFLVRLSKRNLQVYIISGNHDSPERLAFGNRLMNMSGIHISPVYRGDVTPLYFEDNYGKVAIYMLPFIKPVHVRQVFPDEEVVSYTDAVRIAIEHMEVNPEERNILITHQFVTGSKRSESEEIIVGGSDNIDVAVFDIFDYTALGHVHGPQNAGSEKVRYCGTPLKYSFSEANHQKSISVVELKEKGNLSLRTIPLVPEHDMIEIRGSYDEVISKSFYENTTYSTDYVHITLTDEEDIPEAISKLRSVYHNLMKLDYDNTRTRTDQSVRYLEKMEDLSPIELFSEFYKMQNGKSLSQEQTDYIKTAVEKIWGNEQ